ncbi:MAG: DUF2202 domain-containing protein [Clostridiales bacterium]|nr:DUF2202 domain-containing protein [Clostridiales bacterium]
MLKNKNILIMLMLIALLVSGCSTTATLPTNSDENLIVTEESPIVDSTIDTETSETEEVIDEPSDLEASDSDENDYGSYGALEDTDYTIEEMLIYAIQDEYLAKAEYELIVVEFGITQPFENIIKAEENHISILIPLFESYNIEVPENTAADHIVLPETLKEIFEVGVEAEVNNIAMYEMFLTEDLPDDLISAFTFLRDGSESHLRAFQNNLEKYQ